MEEATTRQNGDYTGACLPFGMTRSVNTPEPMQIHAERQVLHRSCSNRTPGSRVVPIDGRPHGKGIPTWFGDSVGHWEGDTLVIDTVNFNGRTRLDTIGHPHSDQLHLIAALLAAGPRTHLLRSDRRGSEDVHEAVEEHAHASRCRPDWEMMEYSCEENNKSLWEGRIKVPKAQAVEPAPCDPCGRRYGSAPRFEARV